MSELEKDATFKLIAGIAECKTIPNKDKVKAIKLLTKLVSSRTLYDEVKVGSGLPADRLEKGALVILLWLFDWNKLGSSNEGFWNYIHYNLWKS